MTQKYRPGNCAERRFNPRRAVGTVALSVVILSTSWSCGVDRNITTEATPAPQSPTASTTPQPSEQPTLAAPSGIDDAIVTALKEQGTTITPIESPEVPKAVTQAAQHANGQTVEMEPDEVSLARVSDANYGTVADPDSTKSDVKLEIQDRLLWVVVFKSYEQAELGPAPPPSDESPRATKFFKVPLAVFVDPGTNKFLLSETAG